MVRKHSNHTWYGSPAVDVFFYGECDINIMAVGLFLNLIQPGGQISLGV